MTTSEQILAKLQKMASEARTTYDKAEASLEAAEKGGASNVCLQQWRSSVYGARTNWCALQDAFQAARAIVEAQPETGVRAFSKCPDKNCTRDHYACHDCRKPWHLAELTRTRDLRERGDPRGALLFGECPRCSTLCYEVDQ